MKRLMLLIIIATATLSVRSQTSRDSTKVAIADAKAVLQAAEMGKQCAVELSLVQKENQLLYGKIAIRDSSIVQYKVALQSQSLLIDNYKFSEQNLIEQNKNYRKEFKSLVKQIKRAKTKTFITALAGVAGIAAVLILK